MLHPHRRRTLESAFRAGSSTALAKAWLSALRAGQAPESVPPEPLYDDWAELLASGLAEIRSYREGHVYIAGYLPQKDVYKVGQTALPVALRMRSLRTAGVLAPLIELRSHFVSDRFRVEALAHRALKHHRVEREFYHAPYSVLESAVDGAAAADERIWSTARLQALLPTEV